MRNNQSRFAPSRQGWSLVFVLFALIFLFTATILWMLNIAGVLIGPWGTILGAILTIVSVVLALPYPGSSTAHKTSTTTYPPIEYVDLGISIYTGALLIHMNPYFRGSTLNLSQGFGRKPRRAIAATNVGEHRRQKCPCFLGIFPSLKPGTYTVSLTSHTREATVTVYAGQLAEIDWR